MRVLVCVSDRFRGRLGGVGAGVTPGEPKQTDSRAALLRPCVGAAHAHTHAPHGGAPVPRGPFDVVRLRACA
jgi:hypothetical protein